MNFVPKIEIRIGSSAFFNKYEDFVPGDIDILSIFDEPIFGKHITTIKLDNKDIFVMYIGNELTTNHLINDIKDYYQACKFITPEFINYIHNQGINFTIENLKEIRHFFDEVKPKHLYTQYICDSYIENNGFFLTDEQLNKAYEIYKKFR